MNAQLLVNSGEFWSTLQHDLRASNHSIYIQAFNFEGDRVGHKLAAELLAAQANDIRILVDCYTKYVLSDRFLYYPKNFFDSALKMEKVQTFKLIAALNHAGVQVKFTNPVGVLLLKFPARNHKKIIVLDDRIAYFGGLNFSEHNFAWHDVMFRIADPEIAAFLKHDFLATWNGRRLYAEKAFDTIHLYLYDGISNEQHFQSLFEQIDAAKEAIVIESPYISSPFYERLQVAHNRGVTVTLITPENNNWKTIRPYTLWAAKRAGIDLRLYQSGMTHVKAMLIDDAVLIVGSTNFDYVSYRTEQELVALITEKSLITEFKKRVMETDLQHSKEFNGNVNDTIGFLHYLILKALSQTLIFLAKL